MPSLTILGHKRFNLEQRQIVGRGHYRNSRAIPHGPRAPDLPQASLASAAKMLAPSTPYQWKPKACHRYIILFFLLLIPLTNHTPDRYACK